MGRDDQQLVTTPRDFDAIFFYVKPSPHHAGMQPCPLCEYVDLEFDLLRSMGRLRYSKCAPLSLVMKLQRYVFNYMHEKQIKQVLILKPVLH